MDREILRIVPEMRSAVLEDAGSGSSILYFACKSDLDLKLLRGFGAEVFTLTQYFRICRRRHLAVLEVSEPLWIRYWPIMFVLVLLARVSRVVRGLPRLRVSTFAIENLRYEERLTMPFLDRHPFCNVLLAKVIRLAIAPTVRVLDCIAFGSRGSAENYDDAFGRHLSGAAAECFLPRFHRCMTCRRSGLDQLPREKIVLFIGEMHPRKGVDVLMRAWSEVGGCMDGWTLQLIGPGNPPEDAESLGVECGFVSDRENIHGVLSRALVVVAPSIRVPRWREQIGLPIVEGVSHGCSVVATSETGILDELRRRSSVWIVPPGAVDDLAKAIQAASDDALERFDRYGSAMVDGSACTASIVSRRMRIDDWLVNSI